MLRLFYCSGVNSFLLQVAVLARLGGVHGNIIKVSGAFYCCRAVNCRLPRKSCSNPHHHYHHHPLLARWHFAGLRLRGGLGPC